MPKIPIGLQEAVTLLVNPDTRQRPTTVVLSRIKYFSDPAVQALQYLDGIHSKDPKEKAQFFRTTLTDVFPFIPQVRFENLNFELLHFFMLTKYFLS